MTSDRLTCSNVFTSKASEEELFLEAVMKTMRHPLLVIDRKMVVVRANRAFLETFLTDEGQTTGIQFFQLGNGQWDIPVLRELMERILLQGEEIVDYLVEHVFERIGRRTVSDVLTAPSGSVRDWRC